MSDVIVSHILPNPLRRKIAVGDVPDSRPAQVLRHRNRDLAAWWHPAADRRPHPGRS